MTDKTLKQKKFAAVAFTLVLLFFSLGLNAQTTNKIVDELVEMGFENVSCTEDAEEVIYTIQNSAYRVPGKGIAKAVELIQQYGLPIDKKCSVIVLDNNIPQLSLRYSGVQGSDTVTSERNWDVSYDLGDSWQKARKTKAQNRSLYKVDILIYPQLSFDNHIITQIYTVLFDLNPTIEVSLWKGSKLSLQVLIPVYNDGYGALNGRVHPGFLTLSQRFRLPYNIFGKVTAGFFNHDQWGLDLDFKRPFKDERFTLLARLGVTNSFYWNGFRLHYDTAPRVTWQVGGSFYWPRYNTEFTLRAQEFLKHEVGAKADMIRHFRYCSIGFYAEKAVHTKMNGGFRFTVLLPPYKYKRFKNKYIPRINTSPNFGIIYNAGNEKTYYKEYKSEASDNIMQANSYNPYFIKSKLLNY